jgi:crotonobetainyl-CoA:carnitine CoA-transferase CaiB-like acyl-CoA transferase
MTGPLEGVRILEVATWAYVPSTGAILADLGGGRHQSRIARG